MSESKEPYKIYVAGPYSPTNCSLHDAAKIAQHNVNVAVNVSNHLMFKGHFVYCPHLTHYLHVHEFPMNFRADWWYRLDNSFLDNWANSLFYIGSSIGADHELERAKSKGYKIFYKLDEVPKISETKQ